ncbi:hypothetical protein N9243_00600 [bacterium]|nr:hypothetical protein [bacterium]|tara:strand:+ start:214 stop:474 length:261 start_codon:yes stop_codon:yes gene_type:complete
MALVTANLTLVNYSGNGFHIWHYVTADDTNNQIDAAGYFNGASNEMNVGDVIFAKTSNGFGMVTVLSNSGGVVDTGDVVSMATDTR